MHPQHPDDTPQPLQVTNRSHSNANKTWGAEGAIALVVSFLPLVGTQIPRNEGTAFVMFSRVKIAIRFFFVGLAVGVLLAPRSGEETRALVRQKADRLLNDVLDAASLGTTYNAREADDTATPTRGRGGNGTRTRAKRASATDEAATEGAEAAAGAGS